MEEVCVAALETICLLATGLIPFGGLTPTPPAWVLVPADWASGRILCRVIRGHSLTQQHPFLAKVEEIPRSEKKLHSLKT